MPKYIYRDISSKSKIKIVKDWLATGDSYDLLKQRHDTTRHVVRLCINEYLANTMSKKSVEEC